MALGQKPFVVCRKDPGQGRVLTFFESRKYSSVVRVADDEEVNVAHVDPVAPSQKCAEVATEHDEVFRRYLDMVCTCYPLPQIA